MHQSTSYGLYSHSCVTGSLDLVTDALNYNYGCAYANEFPVAVEDCDVSKRRTIALEAIGLMMGHNFGWKAFWDSHIPTYLS